MPDPAPHQATAPTSRPTSRPAAPPSSRAVPWPDAWQRALYGDGGFFTAAPGPVAHFRTAVHAAPGLLAAAIVRLARRHGRTRLLDLGAGRGELLAAVAGLPEAAGLQLHGADVVARPAGLPERIGWSAGWSADFGHVPAEAFDGALVIAWELLDDVPCPVLEVAEDGVPRTVLVDPATGRESPGDPAPDADRRWCDRWWPLDGAPEGDRAEVGSPRDALWAQVVGRAAATGSGAHLLAVDYHHLRDGRPPTGTLVGYRGGYAVPPVPDGGCDVTAHVALDAVAAAGEAAGAADTAITDQRAALTGLGVTAGRGPLPAGGPELRAALVHRSQAGELLDPAGLGGFGWLLQRVAGTGA